MERSSKQADRMVVSRYYPAADHSYPRNEVIQQHIPRGTTDQSSMDSESSCPGLTDDRTGSEISLNDDWQYHAHATELWDSFWQLESGQNKKNESDRGSIREALSPVSPPQQRRRPTVQDSGRRSSRWHTPDSPVQKLRNKQPVATYSPLPIPVALPPPGRPVVPSWQSSRPTDQPRRFSRPYGRLLAPCIQQLSHVTAVSISLTTSLDPTGGTNARQPITLANQQLPKSVEYQRPNASLCNRQPTALWSRGLKKSHPIPPISPVEVQWSKKTLANIPPTPSEPESPVFSAATYFPPPGLPAKQHRTMHPSHGSISPLTLRRNQSRSQFFLNTAAETVETLSSPFGPTRAPVVTSGTQQGALDETHNVEVAIAPAQFRRRLGRIWSGITTMLSLVVCWGDGACTRSHNSTQAAENGAKFTVPPT